MKLEINKNFLFKKVFPVFIGAVLGFSYYYFIGCNGSCPISGNPFISTLYGAGMGLLWVLPFNSKKDKSNEQSN